MATINSAQEIIWASGATPAAQNITVPAACNAVLMLWAYNPSTAGHGLLSATLNGNTPAQTRETESNTPEFPATGAAIWFNPATGTPIALDVDWDAAPLEGAITGLVLIENALTSGWRNANSTHTNTGTQQTISVNTASGDLVIALDQRYDGTAPANEAGYTSVLTLSNALEGGRIRSIVATGSTQSASTQDTNFSTIVAVSIIDGGGGGSTPGSGLASKTAPIKSLVNGGLVASARRPGIVIPNRKIIVPRRAPLHLGRNFHSEARL